MTDTNFNVYLYEYLRRQGYKEIAPFHFRTVDNAVYLDPKTSSWVGSVTKGASTVKRVFPYYAYTTDIIDWLENLNADFNYAFSMNESTIEEITLVRNNLSQEQFRLDELVNRIKKVPLEAACQNVKDAVVEIETLLNNIEKGLW